MQQANGNNVRGPERRKKKGMYNRFEPACIHYIREKANKLETSQAQFIMNCVGLAGDKVPPKFKFIFKRRERQRKTAGRVSS